MTPLPDPEVEADETIILNLEADYDYALGSPASAMVTLISDDIIPDEDLTIEQSDIPGNGVYEFQANGIMTVLGDVVVQDGVQLILLAGKKIAFMPGFKVESGGRLNARIGSSP